MDNGDLFYLLGAGLAVSAIVVSFVGLKLKGFPGKAAPLVFLWFAVLIGGATTFAVLHSQDEEAHHEQEVHLPQATEEAEEEEMQ